MMRITLAQVETLYWIARLGSFHGAARHLNLSQPTISVRIRELEEELGVELFDRSGSRAQLTAAGIGALRAAERMLDAAAELRRETASSRGFHGLLRLGVVETVAKVALPAMLAEVNDQRPELRVELSVDVGLNLMQRLNQRELDLIVVTDPRPVEQVRSEIIGMIELAWIGPEDHPLSHRRTVPADLVGERLFTHPRGSTTHQIITDWFSGSQLTPHRLSICSSLATMTELVGAGFGFAVITPALLTPGVHPGIRRMATDPPIPGRPLFLCGLAEAWDPSVGILARIVREKLAEAGALTAT